MLIAKWGLFHHKAPVGPRMEQLVINRAFGAHIGFGNKIRRALARDLQMLNFAKIAAQTPTRFARGALHHAD